jgi:2-octaprenylphenol hydroxylase
MSQTETFDVLIVGGGLVGASLALALERQGRRVGILEESPQSDSGLEQGWDARIFAISPANRQFLDRMGAWPAMSRVGTVGRMDVRGDQGGRVEFSAEEIKVPALAWIAENRWMLASLWQQIAHSSIRVFDSVKADKLLVQQQRASLTLSDGRELDAALVVGADGADSWVRRQSGLKSSVKPYRQSGVVANFSCQLPHGNCARQWFFGDSVLAWLPLPGNRISIVWSTFDPERLMSLDPAALASCVAEAGNHELGQLTALGAAAAFPLRLVRPEAVVAQRIVLVGDAAHTVHPLAGQGVNLGFGDAAELCRQLIGEPDPGDRQALLRYQRSRREAVRSMQMGCDGLFSLFHARPKPGLARLRNTGLTLVNHLGPLKRQFARHAIGF